MEYTKLGKNGTTVSRICLGCMSYGDKKWRDWVLTSDEVRQHFQVSLDAGINFFDTADVYSQGASEEVTGRWLAEMASRDEVVIATKVHGPMGAGTEPRGAVAQAHPRGLRCVTAAAQNRFHRPLPDPSLRLHHADRGNPRRARFAGARGQGPLPRREQHGRVAVSKVLNVQAPTVGIDSRRCRITTTWFIARKSAR